MYSAENEKTYAGKIPRKSAHHTIPIIHISYILPHFVHPVIPLGFDAQTDKKFTGSLLLRFLPVVHTFCDKGREVTM